jgi:hypothetical protein
MFWYLFELSVVLKNTFLSLKNNFLLLTDFSGIKNVLLNLGHLARGYKLCKE